MYKKQTEAVKEWLTSYRKSAEKLNEKYERLRALEARAHSIGAQEITDMPKAPNSSTRDQLAEYLIRKEALEKEIKREQESQNMCRWTIEDLASQLRRDGAEQIIIDRYIIGRPWPQILRKLYGDRPDFQMKIGSYRRKMYRLHEWSLWEISKCWTPGGKRSK